MAFSIYDKLPKSPLPTSPFEFLAKLAEGHKQDLDKLDERIANTQGLFAKLVPAKGHEGMTARVSDKYNQQLTNLMDKYGNNPLSREFSRELTSLVTTFTQDSEVRKIVDSRDFYEKNAGVIEQEKFKGAIVNAPGILDDNGDYSENENLYSWDSFNLTPFGDSGGSIRTIYNILRDNKMRTSGATPKMTPEGKMYWEITDLERIWNTEETRAETARAILDMTFDPTRPDPGLNYLRANAQKLFPDDIQAQEDYAMEYIKNQGIPFNVDWRIEDTRVQEGTKKSGSDSDSDSDVVKVGVIPTVGLDYMTTATGERIMDVDALTQEGSRYSSQIDGLLSTQKLKSISASLLDGSGNLLPNAIITDDQGNRVINDELITDKFEKETALNTNAELRAYQGRQLSARMLNAYYAEEATGTDIDPLGDIKSQVLENVKPATKQKLYNEWINGGSLFSASASEKAYDMIMDNWDYLTPNQKALINRDFRTFTKNGDSKGNTFGTIYSGETIDAETTYKRQLNALQTLLSDKTLDKRVSEPLTILTRGTPNPDGSYVGGWDEYEASVLKEDEVYKKYAEQTNNYLNSTIYTQGYTYSISKSEQRTRIADLLALAVTNLDIQRSNFGPKGGYASQEVSDAMKQDIIADLDEKRGSSNPDYSNIGIRFDESKGKFVLDITTKDGIFEIGGYDQQGLAEIVRMQDPQMSELYVQKKALLIEQLKNTGGRMALYDVPVRDNNTNQLVENNRIIVRSAYETYGSAASQGDYMFCIPEVPGRVFVAKNQWALINMLEGYKEAKQAGRSGDVLKDTVLQLMDGYSVTSINDRDYNIGGRYFPTNRSRFSPVKVTLGEPGK